MDFLLTCDCNQSQTLGTRVIFYKYETINRCRFDNRHPVSNAFCRILEEKSKKVNRYEFKLVSLLSYKHMVKSWQLKTKKLFEAKNLEFYSKTHKAP